MTLAARNLSVRYGKRQILDGLDIDVVQGEVVCLVGPNGAGKSTLLKCLNGLLSPASGEVAIDGRALKEFGRNELARTIAYVPQQAGTAMSLPVIDMVMLGRSPHHGLTSTKQDAAIVRQVVEQLDLSPFAFKLCGQLSGGERQMVLIARALAQEGRFLLLDEPTNNLDLGHQLSVMSTAVAVARERGVGVIMAIHDLSLAARFSDRVVLMDQGTVAASGNWREVLTENNINNAYGVSSVIGVSDGIPYVIPIRRSK